MYVKRQSFRSIKLITILYLVLNVLHNEISNIITEITSIHFGLLYYYVFKQWLFLYIVLSKTQFHKVYTHTS